MDYQAMYAEKRKTPEEAVSMLVSAAAGQSPVCPFG